MMGEEANSLSVGIDLIVVGKIRKVFLGKKSFQEMIFTPQELRRSLTYPDSYIHLAVCFAAKEAFFKALGTGLSGELNWRDVELQREAFGKPMLQVWGHASRLVDSMGISQYTVSLSHTRDYAVALVVVRHSIRAKREQLDPGHGSTAFDLLRPRVHRGELAEVNTGHESNRQ